MMCVKKACMGLNISFTVGIQALEHDRGQTDSRAQSQRLSAAHHNATWSILIGF